MVAKDIEAFPAASPASASPDRLPLPISLGFGVGTVGVSCLLNPITTFFPAMMATVLGMSPAIAGILMTVSKVYDIGADLMIGAVSDRAKTRWGRRRPFMLAGGLLGAIAFALIFNPWFSTGLPAIVFLGAMLVIYSTGYSLFNIPYLAMPAEMTDTPAQRVSLISYRTFFLSIGQMASVPAAAWIIDRLGRGALGYSAMGVCLAAVIVLTTWTTVFTTGKAKRTERVEGGEAISALAHAKLTLENRPFVVLMIAKVFVLGGQAATAASQVLFFLNVLGGGLSGLVYLAVPLNITMALSMPAWVWLIRNIGKQPAYITALLANAVLTLTWAIPHINGSPTALMIRGGLYGVLTAGILLSGTSMLPDTMEYDQRRTGQRREGLFASVYAIVEKLAFAIVPSLIGFYVAASGYLPTKHGALIAQPHSAIIALYVCMAGVPAAAHLIAAAILSFYRLDENALTAESR